MNGISSATDLSALADAVYNAGLTQRNIAELTDQSSSGLVSSDYAGLGAGTRTALDLSGELALNKSAQSNAAQAADVNQVAQTALGQIQTLISGFGNQLLEPSAGTQAGLGTLASTARQLLGQVASLLNTKVGQVYVFAGQDNRTPPVPNPASITQSGFYAAIQSAVVAVSANGAATVQAQVLAAAAPGPTSPFSATLEGSSVSAAADLGGGQTVQLGVLANHNSDAVSAGIGTTSTGSYVRDALTALATIGSLDTSSATDPQVQSLITLTHATLSGADDALNTDIGGLGARQSVITAAQTDLTATATALTGQLDGLEQADTASVASKIAAATTQLQVSYKVIASLSQLSLAKYL